MPAKNQMTKSHPAFETIRKVNQHGQDYWSARELAKILGYQEYRNFLPVIAKAKETCINSGQSIDNHFVDTNEMVSTGSGAQREVEGFDPWPHTLTRAWRIAGRGRF